MASPERSSRMARIIVICLMLLPIHTLPLLAAEQSEVPNGVTQKKETVVEKLIGVATYYAKRYQGKRTTSGARYRPEKLTAAHQSLPLGTKVRVTNLANDKVVTVVVNDRCRKRSFPFIDLSRAAAKKLGFLGAGKAKVAIAPVDEDES